MMRTNVAHQNKHALHKKTGTAASTGYETRFRQIAEVLRVFLDEAELDQGADPNDECRRR